MSKELASVLSCCFSRQPLKEIEILPITQTSIRIGEQHIHLDGLYSTFLLATRPSLFVLWPECFFNRGKL